MATKVITEAGSEMSALLYRHEMVAVVTKLVDLGQAFRVYNSRLGGQGVSVEGDAAISALKKALLEVRGF